MSKKSNLKFVILYCVFGAMLVVGFFLGLAAVWIDTQPLHSHLSNTAIFLLFPGVFGTVMTLLGQYG